MDFSLVIPAFIAGVLMFLAPCTLPLVPAFLSFIAGVDQKDLKDRKKQSQLRKKVFMNGIFYVLGFTVVFVLFGVLAGLVGARLVGQYRIVFTRIAGIFVFLFGLVMLDFLKLKFFQKDAHLKLPPFFQKGKPSTSFLLGGAFAVGWSPCVGPILASVLLLASTSTTIFQGAFLLFVFSAGLAVPFLAVAWGVGSAYSNVAKLNKYMPIISKIGGVFLIIIGILLFFNNMGILIAWGYKWFSFLNYESLLDYL